ncbi:hypothetical protein [Neisseria cinerea]|uniref:hypothetical protein n=1 Tax=Neisseria cinerea TaxID=483 RepID=UPI000D2F6CFF|nr:hypothetical protein [Neisseria cinerea]
MDESKKVKALRFEFEDGDTGAVAAYHVIEYASIDYKFKSVSATLNGYVSEKAYKDGKRRLCSHTLTFDGVDVETVGIDWLYNRATGAESGYVTANAEPVYAE